MANNNTFFDQFKKQMLEKGVDFEQTNNKNEKKSTLLEALENQVQDQERGPLVHGDHGSFTRHSSDSSTKEKEKAVENESGPKNNMTI